ncbi:hypothetical protein FQN54_006638 [Arachnomyces sp. PD_36]|nr:hypothetical protein FQN54_006638 [Arachnomyces sp. PD_36]
MAVEIVPLSKEDIPGAVECIQVAFAGDPYFSWVFNDPSKFSKERNVASLTTRCQWGINNALFYVAKQTDDQPTSSGSSDSDHSEDLKRQTTQSSRIIGVSMWLPPHPPAEPESWYSYFQNWLLSARQLFNNIRFRGRGGLNMKRYGIWKARQSEAQSKIWTDPKGYYFCNIVAVAPGTQGMGIGRKLFQVVTDVADREGKRCYLESSKGVPNVEIYRKMGFEMISEVDCVDGDDACRLYCMVRDPQQKN